MAEAFVNVTEGSGKKLHTFNRTIGANSVEDEIIIPGEHYLASYVVTAPNVSIATANDHILQVMAGASLNVRLRSILITEATSAGATTLATFQLLRLTAAGTGGTAITPAKYDTADAASGATAMTLPTVKGTESTSLRTHRIPIRSALGANALAEAAWIWVARPDMKPIVIAAGTANGVALKSTTAVVGATVDISVEFVEVNFS